MPTGLPVSGDTTTRWAVSCSDISCAACSSVSAGSTITTSLAASSPAVAVTPGRRLAMRSRSETMPHGAPRTTTQWMRWSAIVRASVFTSVSGGQSMTPTCMALRTV